MLPRLLTVVFAFVLVSRTSWSAPLKVFILAGQSNMEGKAKVSLLEYQAGAAETRDLFKHLRVDNRWRERDDVWIKFLDRHGKLTVGYGSKNCIGPELEFGWTMGDHFEEQVVLIKTAWGGKSLYRDFRPPSSGLPAAVHLEQLLERLQKRRPETTMADVKASFGFYYRAMIDEVRTTLNRLEEVFPDYDGQGYELAGMVWFQGWNDMINAEYTAEYSDHLTHFIRDVRKDLNAPQLPFVIGQLGVGGTKDDRPNPKRDVFKAAQIAPASRPEFKHNVSVVRTDQYWDMEADAVFRKGWRDNLDAWNKVGSDYPFHYLGSAKTYSRIGAAFAKSLLELSQQGSFYEPIEREIEGWTVCLDPSLLADAHRETGNLALQALANHLQRVKYITPQQQLDKLQELRIWVELDNPKLGAMQYHPSRGWLLANGHNPRLAKHVHIPRARQLFERKMWAKHPYVVLHELAHAYHDQVLSFDQAAIVEAYEQAKSAGIYDEVLLYTGRKTKHYALSNHKEYFAESTEAYFGVNDFYPFVRAELKQHDPNMFAIMEEVWGSIP